MSTEDKITLTPAQEQIILDAFQKVVDNNYPTITQLVRKVFPSIVDVDGRSIYGRAIKVFVAAQNLQPTPQVNQPLKSEAALTEERKQFILNNKEIMNPLEIAKIIYDNPSITNLHQETRNVANIIKASIPVSQQSRELVDIPQDEYRPPRTTAGVMQRVEKFVFNSAIDKDNMTAQQKAGLEALLSYMNTFHFIHQINLYQKQTSRDLFESSFVRYTYDKPDLSEEECGQYINLANEIVNAASIQGRAEMLNSMMEEQVRNAQDTAARISVSGTLVEHINNLQTELNQCSVRSQRLLDSLKEKRSKRIEAARSANASILNLIQIWKEEKSRLKLLHLADARKKLLEKTAHELSGMEEIKARIMGLNLDEVIHS